MIPTEDFRMDGIPVFVAAPDDVMPGHSIATILFRVGSHDEVFGSAGVTTLAHNFVRACLPPELREYVSAENDGLFTEFTISAPDEDFGQTITALADAIRQPDWSKLAQQQELLLAAERLEMAWPEEQLLACRYGTAGAGTTVVRKFSFGRMKPSVVEAWLAERFNRDNAAIVAFGSLGPGSSFSLPRGFAFNAPVNQALDVHAPAYVNGGPEHEGLLAFQAAAPIGVRNRLALVMLAQLVEKRLITFQNLTREVNFSSRVVDSQTRVLTGFMTVPQHQVVMALNAIRETLDDLCDGMAGRDLFEDQRDDVARGLLLQMASVDSTIHTARVRLMPVLESLEDQIDQIGSMTMDDLVAAIKTCASSMLYQGPDNIHKQVGDLPEWKPKSNKPVVGKTVRLRGGLRYLRRAARISYNDSGLTHWDKRGPLTITFDTCTAVIDNGLSLTIADATGEMFTFYPDAWDDGADIERLIRDNVPLSLFVDIDATDEERREHASIKASVERFTPAGAMRLLTRSRN